MTPMERGIYILFGLCVGWVEERIGLVQYFVLVPSESKGFGCFMGSFRIFNSFVSQTYRELKVSIVCIFRGCLGFC